MYYYKDEVCYYTSDMPLTGLTELTEEEFQNAMAEIQAAKNAAREAQLK